MPRMRSRMAAVAAVAWSSFALAACGGGGAKSPSTCPEGTVLKGSDCVPDDASGDDTSGSSTAAASKGGDDSSSSSGKGSDSASGDGAGGGGAGGGAGGGSAGGGSATAGGDSSGKVPYDKEALEVQLKRAARQVKGHCGGATDDTGKATGPFGQTKVSLVLGRNGRIKGVTVPSEYDGKPAGICIVHAFQKLTFPPYPGSSDATLDYDVEVTAPGK